LIKEWFSFKDQTSIIVFAYYRLDTYKGTYKENRPGRKYNGDSWAIVQICPRSSSISSSVGWEQHLKAAVRC
jgi:hypothetical protein